MTTLDYKALACATMHPLRLAILEHMAETGEALSPVELAALFDEPLGNVSYHVRELHSARFLRLAKKVQRRGAVQHYYRVTQKALHHA